MYNYIVKSVIFSSLCVTNSLSTAVEFSLRPSSSKYSVSPNKVTLNAGQSIVVTVKLFLSHYPNYNRGINGQDDTIQIKTAYFEQKVDCCFFLHSRDSDSKTRSQSPTSRNPKAALYDEKIKLLEENLSSLESKFPNIQLIVKNSLAIERIAFEEKSEKVLFIKIFIAYTNINNYNCIF